VLPLSPLSPVLPLCLLPSALQASHACSFPSHMLVCVWVCACACAFLSFPRLPPPPTPWLWRSLSGVLWHGLRQQWTQRVQRSRGCGYTCCSPL